MTAFLATIRTSFRRQLTYRAANLSGLATNLMFAFFRAAVLIALFNEQSSVNGLSIQDAITYAGLTQSLIGYLSFFHWYDMMHTVYDGQIGADLLKPMGLFTYWLGIDIGRAMGSFLIRSLPLFLVFALFYHVVWPSSILHWLAFLLAIIQALLVSFAWRFLVNLAAFWTPNALGDRSLRFRIILDLLRFLHAPGPIPRLAGEFLKTVPLWCQHLHSNRNLPWDRSRSCHGGILADSVGLGCDPDPH